MLVVSNTSPISNLAIIDRLALLRAQFQELWIPAAVESELSQLQHVTASARVTQAIGEGWIKSRAVASDRLLLLLKAGLDRGEAEAIALGIEMSADLVLLDERAGRTAASRAGLKVAGILGVLLQAKASGQIPALKPELGALRAKARFFVTPSLERQVLNLAGE